MSGRIVLSEYEDRRVELTPEDAAFAHRRLGGRIAVRRDLAGKAYVLNPRQFVGLATLPSGRVLECRAKVPVRNLFALLAAALDLPDPFLDAPAGTDRMDEVPEFVAARFAALVEERIDRGLHRAYVEEEGNLPTVRGRIAVAEDIRANHVLRHRTYCRHAEYSWDVPENRVVRQVIRLLAGWRLGSALRRRLSLLDGLLEEVTPGRYAAGDLDRFAYHRQNEGYRPLHRLCRLFLEGASPSADVGTFAFDAFLVDMNRLFEAFVTRALRDRAPRGLAVHPQVRVALDLAGTVAMRPDVLLRRWGRAALVADCKYKRLVPGEHHHHDVYQALAYCTALGVPTGLLVYPRHMSPVDAAIVVRHAGVTIREATFNLFGDRDALRAACDQLAELAFGLAGEGPDLRRHGEQVA